MARQKRLYALFEKQPDVTWKRAGSFAYHKEMAVRIFQNRLLNGALGQGPLAELRVVKT